MLSARMQNTPLSRRHALWQAQELHCPIRLVIILDKRQAIDSLKACNVPEIEVMRDLSGRWPPLSGVDDTGAVLVRPDGHVLWRCKDAEHLLMRLRAALQTCLGKCK